MKITPELIQYLESLARIELTPAEEATAVSYTHLTLPTN